MNPRRFLNLMRSPAGALVLFLVAFAVILLLINSRRGAGSTTKDSRLEKVTPAPGAKPGSGSLLPQSLRFAMSPFNPPQPADRPATPQAKATPKQGAGTPMLPPISLVAETPAPPTTEAKTISSEFVPFGRLVPCELVITVDSSSIHTPIVGLVTEDVFHHGQLIIPAGTEVHGTATVDRAGERIASNGRWTLVWQNGEELQVSGLALDHERDADSGSWAITDGSAGLRGRLIKSDNLAEVKLYVAALLSGAADVFTERGTSAFGSYALPTLQNAPLKGAQGVLDRYAQQILQTIERDGFYVRVPAGKQFYLYVTQTLDRADAQIGGSAVAALETMNPVTPPADSRSSRAPAFRTTSPSGAVRPFSFSTSSPSLTR